MSKPNPKAIERLREYINPGNTIWVDVKHVARSGMSRSIAVYRIVHNEPRTLSYNVSQALGWGWDDRRMAVKVSGCGMDMGFELIYCLSHCLYPNGFECVGKGCYSNDHSNGDRDYSPHHHKDGGYALKSRWL